MEHQAGKQIKALRSDHVEEYLFSELEENLEYHWIVSMLTVLRTPQHNRVV
jgi:hypothetical protein